MRYHAHALAANGVDVDLVGLEGTPLPRRSPTSRASPSTACRPPRLQIRGELTGSTYAVAGLFDALRISFRLWRTLRRAAPPGSGARPEPAGVPDAGGQLVLAAAHAASASSSTGTTSATRCCSCGWGVASGGAAGALVRAARRAARRCEPVRVARPGRVPREPLRRASTRSVLYDRPASVFVPIERGERERFRQALFARLGIRAEHRRVHRLSRPAGPRTRTSTSSSKR